MCFGGGGGGGPDPAAERRAAEDRVAADAATAEETAKVKREDISEALEARRTGEGRGGGGGRGRRSLFRSGGSGAGFIGRFNR